MNFVVTFILGMIFGGATIWRMSRDSQEGNEDSNDVQATSIEVVNEADEEATEEVIELVAEPVTEVIAEEIVVGEATKEITIEQGDEPEFIEIAEPGSDESNDDSNDGDSDGDSDSDIDDEESGTVAPVETLQQIIGIGPTYARRINDAGITSIEALSQMSAGSLQQIVTPGKSTPTAETEKWLEQAHELANA